MATRNYEDTNPYSTQNNVYGGAAANGQAGSQTPASQTNAATQTKSAPADPFASFGNAAQQWGQLFKNYIGQTQGSAGQYLTPGSPTTPNQQYKAGQWQYPGTNGPLQNGAALQYVGAAPGLMPPVMGAKTPSAPMLDSSQSAIGVKKPSIPSGETWVNPIAKPDDPNDLEGMAAWYRGFADDPLNGDPSYATITAADVNNYRALAVSGKINMTIGDWAKAGKPGGQWTPDVPQGGPYTGTTPQDTQTADRGGVAGVGAGGAQVPSGRTPTTPGAADGTGANGDLGTLLDYYKQLMGPLHQQEQEDYLRQLATAGANSGAINSGAYGEAQGRGLADLINNENAGIYGNLFTGSESAKDRSLQKALAEITGNYGLQSAQIGASAAGASAAASSGAEKYKADLAYKQFQDELPYQDKWHGYNFQLGEDQLSGQQFQYLLSLMGGLTFPPSGVLPQLPSGGFF